MDSMHCPKCGTEKKPGRPCTKCLLELGLEPSVPRIEHVGAYRILSRLGVGAMGEVFRARDPRLDRDVAIKVLPEALASDEDRIARFRREARVAASLNHPNIASVYGFEDVSSTHFLVMELVEGQTLAERLQGGALPVDEALDVVRQIAGGLEAAHESGVVHRDLKPSNVKLTPGGKAKILDFGLAKALDEERRPMDLEASPTITAHLTVVGTVFGTVPYMSPEQARGRPVDKRSDIWALGCLLYECLAGRRAFQGDTATDVLGKVLERDPDWDALPARTPPRVRELLERCLEKDLEHRERDAGDVRIELERAHAAREWSSTRPVRFAKLRRRQWARSVLPWAVAGVTSAAAALLLVRSMVSTQAPPLPRKMGLPLHVDVTDPDVPRFASSDTATVAISPDGTKLAYVGSAPGFFPGGSAIFVRTADGAQPSVRIDTPSAYYALADPFFSPDGKWIGFSAVSIYKVPVSGGKPVLLAENTSFGGTKGAIWTEHGIVYSPAAKAGLFRVGENGGPPEPLTVPDAAKGEVSHRWPSALPDGRHLLFTIKKEGIASFDQGEIALLDLESRSWRTILRGGSFARYVPSGQIIFGRDGAILAVPFDLRAGKVTGPPVTVLEGVMTEPGSGAAQFAVASEAGSLLYVPGGPNIKRKEFVWVDRKGGTTPVGAPLAAYDVPRLSPEGSRIATNLFGATDAVVVYDLRDRSTTRVPMGGNCSLKCWHPDGRQVLLASDAEGPKQALYLVNVEGAGKPRRLAMEEQQTSADNFLARLPDGIGVLSAVGDHLTLTYLETNPRAQPLTGFGEVQPSRPAVSPDGRWLAYDADVAGTREVFVRSFPTGNGSWQISHGGGGAATWAPGGNEIVYQRTPYVATSVLSVKLAITPHGISADTPREIFQISGDLWLDGFHPDGRRLIAAKVAPAQFPGARVLEILNWFDQVQAKVSPN